MYKEKYLKYKNKYLELQSNPKYSSLFDRIGFANKSNTSNKIKYLAMRDTLQQKGGTIDFKVFYNEEEIKLDEEDREDLHTYQNIIDFAVNRKEINPKLLDIINKDGIKNTIRFSRQFLEPIKNGDELYLYQVNQSIPHINTIKLVSGKDKVKDKETSFLGLSKNELTDIKTAIKNSDFRNYFGFFKGNENGECTGYNQDGILLYKGHCKNKQVHGNGILYYSSGNIKYDGEWENNMKNGKGTLFFNELEKKMYEGNWLKDKANGHGIRYDEKGNKISEGEWKDNVLSGNNILFYTSGKKQYEGDMLNDMKNGHGTTYNEDGNKIYEGGWLNDKPNGKGILYQGSVKIYEGNTINGIRDGQAVSYYNNGNVEYNGVWKNNLPHGKGMLYSDTNVQQYDGNWENGMRNGLGKSFYEDGSLEYDGEWKDNEPLNYN